jgi:deoxyribonuclease-4
VKPVRIGAHVSIAGGLERALERGAEVGCDVIQIFSRSNQQWAARRIGEAEVAAWRAARARTGVEPAMVHACYLLNLAAPRRWLREKSIRALADELRRCALLGIPNLVIHPGAHCGDGEATGVARIAEAIERAYAAQPDNPTRLLLENTAGQGSTLGYRFEHLRDILGAMRSGAERVGVCIDTAHTLAAGHDITTVDGWQRVFERLDQAVGVDRVAGFHVNDSKTPLGSRVDRHQHLGRGYLGLGALRCLVNDPRFAGLPMVIETPRGPSPPGRDTGSRGVTRWASPKPSDDADRVNLAILRALAGRRRVGPRARRLAAAPMA